MIQLHFFLHLKIKPARISLVPCEISHLEKLIAGGSPFEKSFGYHVADGYQEFSEVLTHSLATLIKGNLEPRWWSYLFVHQKSQTLIGVGGYRGNPSPDGSVEIRFSIAPIYRQRGYAQEAAQMLITHAFSYSEIRTVFAYTSANKNASSSILRKCSMAPVQEFYSLDDSRIWKWEIRKTPQPKAIVGRHPFGGYKMSGGGTKAGGKDYLRSLHLTKINH